MCFLDEKLFLGSITKGAKAADSFGLCFLQSFGEHPLDRRKFTKLALLSGCFGPLLSACRTVDSANLESLPLDASVGTPEQRIKRAKERSHRAHQAFMQTGNDFKMMGNEQIVMLLYPGFAALDLVGPHYLFSSMMGAKIHLVSSANDLAPVKSGEGMEILPTHLQKDCPEAADILFVPGGTDGTVQAMKNSAFIDFIKTQGAKAKYITSVCTGSLLLGKAGLLKGKKATSHWVTLDLLPELGAIPVRQRVVWDGNIVTGGGVTAGIDFGLQMVAALRGRTYAEAIQLQAEYNPLPPFDSGSPDQADPFVTENLTGMFAPFIEKLRNEI